MKRLIPILAALLFALPALAADPSEMLKDPALEKRAHDLGKELRCLVCQSESIEDSNADLARDLRVIVREQISLGKSDADIRNFVVDRYGDYVLLKPPFKLSTLALWLGPFLLLVVGIWAAARFYFSRAKKVDILTPKPLTPEEQRRLDALLKEGQ